MMKTKQLLLLLFCIAFSGYNYGQRTQYFTKSFKKDNGMYGTVEISTRPFSWGMLFVQLNSVTVEGYRTSAGNFSGSDLSNYGISFPFRCNNCFVDVSGTASMKLTDVTYRDKGDFSTRVFIVDKSNPTVGFSSSVKERHNRLRSERNANNYFETNGNVDYLNINGVSGADLGKLTEAARKYAADQQRKEKYNSLLSSARYESDLNQKLSLLRQAQNYTDDSFDIDAMITETENEIELERQREMEKQQAEQEANNEDDVNDNNNSSSNSSKSSTETSNEEEDDEENKEENKRTSTAYNQRLKTANERNAELAGQNAAATMGIMFILGGVIYSDYGWTDESIYSPKETNLHMGFDIGFSTTSAPLNFATKTLIEDPITFEQYYEELNDPAQQVTLNLGGSVLLGVEGSNYKAKIFGGGKVGTSPILSGTHTSLFYGGQVSLGIRNIKVMGAYQSGGRNYTISDPLLEEEEGRGKSNVNFTNLRAGLEFSWYGDSKAYGRNHLSLGLIQEQITKLKNETAIELVFDGERIIDDIVYDSQGQAGYFFQEEFLDSLNKLDDYKFFGAFLEWRHDHHGTLSIEYFPKYAHTGTQNEFFRFDDWDDKMNFMLTISFTRNLDSFFKL